MLKSPFFHCYKSSLRTEHLASFDELVLEHLEGLRGDFKDYEDLFEYFGHADYFLSERVRDSLMSKVRRNFGNDAIFESTVDRTGKCQKSGQILPEIGFTDDEFKALISSVEERAFRPRGGLIHQTSTPREFRKCKAFIEDKAEAYDVVVDALNVTHMKTYGSREKKLTDLVNVLVRKKFKPLLIMREHQLKELRLNLRNCQILSVQDVTQDDLFLILAALEKRSYFVSNDNFREHHNGLMDAASMRLFNRWQIRHQIRHERIGNKANISMPPTFELRPILCGNVWHLPIQRKKLEKYSDDRHVMTAPDEWMCVRKP